MIAPVVDITFVLPLSVAQATIVQAQVIATMASTLTAIKAKGVRTHIEVTFIMQVGQAQLHSQLLTATSGTAEVVNRTIAQKMKAGSATPGIEMGLRVIFLGSSTDAAVAKAAASYAHGAKGKVALAINKML